MHLRIAVDEGDHACGLLGKGIARRVNKVAADVHQGAAAALNLVADVGRVDVEVAEEADDGAKLADAAFVATTRAGEAIGDGSRP